MDIHSYLTDASSPRLSNRNDVLNHSNPRVDRADDKCGEPLAHGQLNFPHF